jgi:hypothetical protein
VCTPMPLFLPEARILPENEPLKSRGLTSSKP